MTDGSIKSSDSSIAMGDWFQELPHTQKSADVQFSPISPMSSFFKDPEAERFPICWFTPQIFAAARTWPVKARSLELNPHLPHRWQGPKYLSHNNLSRRMYISRRLESGVEPGIKPRHPNMKLWAAQVVS